MMLVRAPEARTKMGVIYICEQFLHVSRTCNMAHQSKGMANLEKFLLTDYLLVASPPLRRKSIYPFDKSAIFFGVRHTHIVATFSGPKLLVSYKCTDKAM